MEDGGVVALGVEAGEVEAESGLVRSIVGKEGESVGGGDGFMVVASHKLVKIRRDVMITKWKEGFGRQRGRSRDLTYLEQS